MKTLDEPGPDPGPMRESAGDMAARQGATPPAWLGRSRWSLFADVVGGWRDNGQKIRQLVALLRAATSPALVRKRLDRLFDKGFIDERPSISQMLLAARDQMILAAAEETKIFYKSQGIPWVFHNLRRLISGPATMADPVGLFSPRDAIIEHVLQTFHRHPHYDVLLLYAHDGAPGDPDASAELQRQAEALRDGRHPKQRALSSLIEDGAYHQRLPLEIEAIRQNPGAPARAIPAGLVDDPALMAGMDQFKDMRGFMRYARRLPEGPLWALGAWFMVVWNETLGAVTTLQTRPKLRVSCCDEAIARRHFRLS